MRFREHESSCLSKNLDNELFFSEMYSCIENMILWPTYWLLGTYLENKQHQHEVLKPGKLKPVIYQTLVYYGSKGT